MGFDPTASLPADARVFGLTPLGARGPLRLGDPVDVAELHYLRHAIFQQEWPVGTSRGDYIRSARDLAVDPRSGVLVSEYRHYGWHVAIVGRSRSLQGSQGYPLMMVEYRVVNGYWTTVLQLRQGYAHFEAGYRTRKLWLRLPT
ncbi:MAG: hypothetical protein H0V51_19750 [Chloroflexi bacterium]|nr:hypothetical protein [Chloroflexota bacterium]